MKLKPLMTLVLAACCLIFGCREEPTTARKTKPTQGESSTATTLASTASRKPSMGWLFVDPRGKWGMEKTQALSQIRKEAGLILTITEDSQSETWLGSQLLFVRGEKMVHFDLLFRCGFDSDGFNLLAISYVSDKASMSDARYLYEALCRQAADKFNASGSYRVKPFKAGYLHDTSADTPFGSSFASGDVMYVLEWNHGGTRSAVAAYRNTGEGQMRTYIQLEHHRK